MNKLLSGALLGAMAVAAATANAGVSGWVSNPQSIQQTKPQSNMVVPDDENRTEIDNQPSTIPVQKTTPKINLPRADDSQASAPSNAVTQEIERHIAKTSVIINTSEVQALKSNEYLAAVMFNSALVQVGLELKTKSESPTSINLYRNAVGCINSKKSPALIDVAKKIATEHSKLVDLSKITSTNPQIGSGYTAACL